MLFRSLPSNEGCRPQVQVSSPTHPTRAHLDRHIDESQRGRCIDSRDRVLTGTRCINNKVSTSTAGQAYQQGPCISTIGECIDDGAGVLMAGQAI